MDRIQLEKSHRATRIEYESDELMSFGHGLVLPKLCICSAVEILGLLV